MPLLLYQTLPFPPLKYYHRQIALIFCALASITHTIAAEIPPPQFIPQTAPVTDHAYAPQALLPGGQVLPLYPENSPFLNNERIHEPEIYQMHPQVPGRVNKITNIHNPSIEFHPVEKGSNTGATIIIAAGGGHKTLNVAGAGTDIASHFYHYGINCVVLRYRLRADGYNAEVDAVNDTLQAIRLIRSHAKEWNLDPNKIGVMGFSAGGEPCSASALTYDRFDAANNNPSDPLAGISARPDFLGLIYTGPSALTKNPELAFPNDIPPAFIASSSYGEARHTIWAYDYYMAMLKQKVPNIEIHLYAQGGHGGGIKDRKGTPYGTWQKRFIDWFRDLGFLEKPGIQTKADKDIQDHLAKSAG